MYYDLQLIHQDPNLDVSLIIQNSVWSHPISPVPGEIFTSVILNLFILVTDLINF